MRVLELAADNRETEPGEGATRSMSTSALEVEHTHAWGVRLDTNNEEDNCGERSSTVWRR
jgi:hypothetical protein